MNVVLITLCLAIYLAVAIYIPGEGPLAALFGMGLALLAGLVVSRAVNVREERSFLLQILWAALAARMVVGILIFNFRLQEFFGGDAFAYDFAGQMLADYWRSPLRSLPHPLGGRELGFSYLVAVVYSVIGRNSLAIQFFNATLGAATAVLVYLCAQHLFHNLRVARISALLVAFYPSLVLWSAQGLKDGPIVFLLALAMLMTLRLGERLSISRAVILVSALLAILSLRFYVFYMMVAAIGGAFVIGMRQVSAQSIGRQVAALLVLGLALTYFGVLRTADQQFDAYANFERIQITRQDLSHSAQSGYGRDVDVSTTTGALTAIPQGMVYLLFAPFPWQLLSLRQAITLPEMIVWWAAFPLLVLGGWFAIKYRLRATLPILTFTTMLTLAYSIFQGNVGTAYRQRSQLLIFYFIFVAVGYVLLRERQEERQRQILLTKQELAQQVAAARVRRQRERWQQERAKELADQGAGLARKS